MITQTEIDRLNAKKLLIRLQEDFNPFMLEESLVNWYFNNMRKDVSAAWTKHNQKGVDLMLAELRLNAMIKPAQTHEHLFRSHCYQLAVDKIHDELMSK